MVFKQLHDWCYSRQPILLHGLISKHRLTMWGIKKNWKNEGETGFSGSSRLWTGDASTLCPVKIQIARVHWPHGESTREACWRSDSKTKLINDTEDSNCFNYGQLQQLFLVLLWSQPPTKCTDVNILNDLIQIQLKSGPEPVEWVICWRVRLASTTTAFKGRVWHLK